MRVNPFCRPVLVLASVLASVLAPVLAPGPGPRGPSLLAAAEGRAGEARRPAPASLEESVRRLVEARSAPGGWRVGVVIQDHEGKVRASVEPDLPLSPASNQKVLVVAAALALLGPDFQYETLLASPSPPSGGAVTALVVRGEGDPRISARAQGGDPTAVFRAWAARLRGLGVERISGDLLIDDSRFDSVRFFPGWKASQAGNPYCAEVSALNYNENCVDIAVRPTRPGEAARVELRPATSHVEIVNECRTAAGGKGRPVFHRLPGTNRLRVSGSIPSSLRQVTGTVTVQDPALYFGDVLARVLRAEGISLGGQVARGTLAQAAGAAPHVLLRHTSTLADDLNVINKRSVNLHAEALLKALGARLEAEGSAPGGGRAIQRFLRKEGIPDAGLRVEDGSGLSEGNRVTAATLGGVLDWLRRQAFFPAYFQSLPVAGKDGTLERRFRGRTSAGHVHAKTGYIAGVSSLSGYVERGGRHWVFSVLVNGLRAGGQDRDAARRLQEEVADLIYAAMAG